MWIWDIVREEPSAHCLMTAAAGALGGAQSHHVPFPTVVLHLATMGGQAKARGAGECE